MSQRLLGWATLAVAVTCGVAVSQDEPGSMATRPAGTAVRPTEHVKHPELDAAWTTYEEAVKAEADTVAAVIEAEFEKATAAGNMDAAEKWQAIREQFEREGTLPREAALQEVVPDAAKGLQEASGRLEEAYDRVTQTLTREKRLVEARRVRDEKATLAPRGFEAVAWLRVRDKSGMFNAGGGRDNAEYEAYRKTQVQLIKSPLVLMAALRRPGVNSLEALKGEEDKVGWLMRNVQVSAPMESETLQVKLRGEDPREVATIVNAVTNAYLTDVVNKEKAELLSRRDTLEKKYKENMAEVRSRVDTYNNLVRSLGTTDSAEVATQRALLLDHLETLRAQQTHLQRDLSLIDAELAVMDAKARGEITLEQSVPEETIDAMVLRDSQFVELRDRLAGIEEAIVFQAQRSVRGPNDPAVKRLQDMRDSMLVRMERRREELKPQILTQLTLDAASRRSGAAAESPVVPRMRREILARQLEQTTKDLDRVANEVEELGQANADLMARKLEIDQLVKVTDEIGVQLNAMELDIAMPNRVELIEEASAPEWNDLNRNEVGGATGNADAGTKQGSSAESVGKDGF